MLWWYVIAIIFVIGFGLLLVCERTKNDVFGHAGMAIIILTLLYMIASHAPLI